jgi:hypothetical protein
MESSLENTISSYEILLKSLSFLFVLILLLLLINPKGINKIFGYQILITGPLLIAIGLLVRDIFIYKNNPNQSWLASLTLSSKPWFIYAIIGLIFILTIATIFIILAIGNIFEDKDNKMNIPVLVNLIIICIFIVIALGIYNNYRQKDNIYMNSFSGYLKDVYNLRTKYTIFFILFILVVSILYFVNPFEIMTTYGGPTVFFTLFIGIIFLIMIMIYQIYLSNPSTSTDSIPSFLTLFGKGMYILASIVISIGLVYGLMKFMGIFNQDASKPETWGYIFFNLFLFAFMLGIIYKLLDVGGYLNKNPFYRLIINTILYIPCLLVSLFEKSKNIFRQTTNNGTTKPSEIKILIISIILLGGYFTWLIIAKPFIQKTYLKQGGKQIINQPMQTNKLSNVISYQQLNESDKFDYQYALSFWFYIDSFPPSTSASYNKTVSILSYGENPNIQYNSNDNALFITIKQQQTNKKYSKEKELNVNDIYDWKNTKEKISNAIKNVKMLNVTYDTDSDGNRIIYKHENVLLQKWNHIVINYSGGTLDVFYNGKLVKSSIEVVPYMKYDMLNVGTENGISGNVANVMYFKKPLDIYTINTLYTSLKDSNPPVIPTNNQILSVNI